MLAKQLLYFAGADAAGLVLGARVPIVVPGRQDAMETKMASCVLASLAAAHVHDAASSVAARPQGSTVTPA